MQASSFLSVGFIDLNARSDTLPEQITYNTSSAATRAKDQVRFKRVNLKLINLRDILQLSHFGQQLKSIFWEIEWEKRALGKSYHQPSSDLKKRCYCFLVIPVNREWAPRSGQDTRVEVKEIALFWESKPPGLPFACLSVSIKISIDTQCCLICFCVPSFPPGFAREHAQTLPCAGPQRWIVNHKARGACARIKKIDVRYFYLNKDHENR